MGCCIGRQSLPDIGSSHGDSACNDPNAGVAAMDASGNNSVAPGVTASVLQAAVAVSSRADRSQVLSGVASAGVNVGGGGQGLRIFLDGSNLSPVIDSLIMQTLGLIRTMVDNEQPPPEAMMYLHKIADHDVGWLAIVNSMINVISCEDPLGPAVMTLILDECPLPAKETVMKLANSLSVSGQSARSGRDDYARQRNICILYGCLAEKLAGATSMSLLNKNLVDYLLENLKLDKHPCVIVHSLVAIEKFSLTSESKAYLNRHLFDGDPQAFERLEGWRHDTADFQKREVGFCAEWIQENLFTRPDREVPHPNADGRDEVRAMLNANDTSEYLKMSADGLEARSDVLSFESVRCTFQADSGSWYYEVLLVTSGVMQIGWATRSSKFLNYDGYGIGDDELSVAYDGCRQLIWHNAQSKQHTHRCWKAGDILGCYLNINDMVVVFALNGDPLPPQNQIFNKARQGFFAAASFMSFQQCIFNFGREPFRYPPSCPFETFNKHGLLQEQDRLILPRHKKIDLLKRVSVKDDGCSLCYDATANVTLQPCGHRGLCEMCAVQVDVCPFCRQVIQSKDVDISCDGACAVVLPP